MTMLLWSIKSCDVIKKLCDKLAQTRMAIEMKVVIVDGSIYY